MKKYIVKLLKIIGETLGILLFLLFLIFVFGAHPLIVGFFFLVYIYNKIKDFVDFIKTERDLDR